jgi:hypothetical protein
MHISTFTDDEDLGYCRLTCRAEHGCVTPRRRVPLAYSSTTADGLLGCEIWVSPVLENLSLSLACRYSISLLVLDLHAIHHTDILTVRNKATQRHRAMRRISGAVATGRIRRRGCPTSPIDHRFTRLARTFRHFSRIQYPTRFCIPYE